MGNCQLKLKIHFKLFFKPSSIIYAEFSVAEPKKKKNGQIMGNSELTLKIHFKVFSYHNMLEVE